MPLPSTRKTDNLFSSILRDIPTRCLELARETGAFHHGRQIRTVQQLLQGVLLYCGLDYSLAETAAVFTLLFAEIPHQAIDSRLQLCGQWLEACVEQMLRIEDGGVFEGKRRVLVVDEPGSRANLGSSGTDSHLGKRLLQFHKANRSLSQIHRGVG